MNLESISCEWREERLYVLHMIEDLKAEQRRQSEAAAVAKENVEKKAVRDINAAYDRIRALENSGIVMNLKNWILVGLLSVVSAIGFELAKAVFKSFTSH